MHSYYIVETYEQTNSSWYSAECSKATDGYNQTGQLHAHRQVIIRFAFFTTAFDHTFYKLMSASLSPVNSFVVKPLSEDWKILTCVEYLLNVSAIINVINALVFIQKPSMILKTPYKSIK